MIGRIYERVGIKFQVVDLPTDPLTAIEHVVYKRVSLPNVEATWVLPMSTFVHDFKLEQVTKPVN